jgi:hypothetical protein
MQRTTKFARSTSTNSAPTSSSSQRARILDLLISARGGWVPSPEIAACAQQYNARLFELRRLNFQIENRVEEVNGTRLSCFRLVSSPAQASSPTTPAAADRVVPVNSKTKSADVVTSDPRARQLALF